MRITQLLLTIAIAGLLASPAHAKLTVLDKDPVVVRATNGAATARGSLGVLNTGPHEVSATVDLQANAVPSVDCVGSKTVAAGTAEDLSFTCSGVKDLDRAAKGQLVVVGSDEAVAHPVTIAPALESTTWALALIGGALGLAALLVLGVWVWACADAARKAKFHGRAPGPKWDFADSWATTLTTVGALLATVLAAVTYPEGPQHIDKDTVTALSVLFAAWVVIAPFVFQAWRHDDVPVAGPGSTLWGSNRVLLVCCGLTYAAVIGQLATAALLTYELTDGGAEGWVAVGAAAFLGLAATRYFILTTAHQADTDWKAITDKAEAGAEVEMIALEGAPTTMRIPAQPGPVRWSVP